MLSPEEKEQLRQEARSQELRRDFETLRRNARPADPKNLDLDAYLAFLTDFARIFPQAARSPVITGEGFLI